MSKKYKIIKEDTIEIYGHTLYRIKALKDVGFYKKGTLGGYIESETNLSQGDDTAWVADNAKVYGSAYICNNAIACKNAIVKDLKMDCDILACGDSILVGNGLDENELSGFAVICDNACLKLKVNKFSFGNGSVIGGDSVMIIDNDNILSVGSGEFQREKFIEMNLEDKKIED